jgi:hypothetical protein
MIQVACDVHAMPLVRYKVVPHETLAKSLRTTSRKMNEHSIAWVVNMMVEMKMTNNIIHPEACIEIQSFGPNFMYYFHFS